MKTIGEALQSLGRDTKNSGDALAASLAELMADPGVAHIALVILSSNDDLLDKVMKSICMGILVGQIMEKP